MANIHNYDDERLANIKRIQDERKKEASFFAQAREKIEIKIRPGEVATQARELGQALKDDIFQKDGLLVNIDRLKEKRAYNKFFLEAGALVINPLTIEEIQAYGNEYCKWLRWNDRHGNFTPCDCPIGVAKQLANIKKEWPFPYLAGIVQFPTIRNDGSLLLQPGYDDASGLYADFEPEDYTGILQNPTREDAIEALYYLKEVISEFPFKTDCDQSVALAAILTSIIRPFVKTSPLFAITAPCPGTGKSALADLISIITTGKPASAFKYFSDDIELAKSLFAVLLRGPSVILIDNVTGIVNSQVLCIALTQETMAQRILGQSKTISVSTSTMMMMTGNNLTLAEDMTRRTLYCCLDANVEKPAERQFKRNIYSFARQERAKIITAILAIHKAYHLANISEMNELKPMNGFNDWSDKIRGPLYWLGEADPLDSQATLESLDPTRGNAEAVFLAWHELFGNEKKSAQDIIEAIDNALQDEKAKDLKDALLATIISPKGLGIRTLGIWLSKNTNAIYGGYKLHCLGKYKGQAIWQLIQVW